MSSGRDGWMEGGEREREHLEEQQWGKEAGRGFFLVNLTLSHSLPM